MPSGIGEQMNYTPIPSRDLQPSYVIVGERASQTGLGADLRELWTVFFAGWRMILISLGAFVALALLFLLVVPATYIASADVLLDPRQRQVVSGEVIDPRMGVSALGADTLMLDSQVQVILSRPVLVEFIRSENLTADSELMSGVSAQFMAFSANSGDAVADENNPVINEVVAALFEQLEVARETNTYVIRIAYKSENPYKAAHYANRVAEIYLDQLNGSNLATTQEAADALASRLSSLREAASQANQQVEQYRQANGLIGTQDLLLVEQDLRDLNTQLSLAKVATGDAEAQFVAVQGASSDAIDTGSLQSSVITQLQIDMSTLDVEEAQLRSKYLPRHPELQRVRDQKAAVRASMQAEAKRIAERAKSQLAVAKSKQAKLESQLVELEARAGISNTASVRLRELEREALASQAVYETFLTRSKEVLEQTELPNETARIISRASPPTEAKSPKAMLVLGGAIMAGLMLGIGIVWVRHIVRTDINVSGGQFGHPASTPPFTPRTPPPPRPDGPPTSGPPSGGSAGTRRAPMHPGMYRQPTAPARSNLPNTPLYRHRAPEGGPTRPTRSAKAWQVARPPRGGAG